MAGEQEASRSNAGALTLEQTIMFLLETPLFEQLSATELAEVVGIMQVQRLREGQVLFREGDEGDAWYVIFEGMCSVRKESDVGPSRHIADLGPRTCFGEMAVLDGKAKRAQAVGHRVPWLGGGVRQIADGKTEPLDFGNGVHGAGNWGSALVKDAFQIQEKTADRHPCPSPNAL